MPRTIGVFVTTISLAAGTLLAGCSASVGSSNSLNTGKAETVIGKGLTEQLGGKVTVVCPGDVKIEKGGTFDCQATSLEGEKATVAVVQKDDQGNVSYSVSSTP